MTRHPFLALALALLAATAAFEVAAQMPPPGDPAATLSRADASGVVPPVGNTVDVAAANWTNTIGASELGAVWTDPDFDPDQRTFHYARVLEIPTPRWIVYDAFRFGVDIPEDAETVHQERAYTSPIWYTPTN